MGIWIYISPNNFNNALKILFKLGYCLVDNTTILNKHHVSLHKDKVVVELHKNIFNPFTEIDESYLRANIRTYVLDNQNVFTFNITATLLHLIYHLYMDTYLACGSLYQALAI